MDWNYPCLHVSVYHMMLSQLHLEPHVDALYSIIITELSFRNSGPLEIVISLQNREQILYTYVHTTQDLPFSVLLAILFCTSPNWLSGFLVRTPPNWLSGFLVRTP